MQKKSVKENLNQFTMNLAKKTYAKSVPFMIYEPKVPEALKKEVEKEK